MPARFWDRAILHVDMDAFYASVEQRDRPELRGKPVIVGGAPERRGVVSAASYEVRPYGVHSAMATSKALRLCPHAILVPVRMERYEEVSDQIHEVFAQFTPDVQPVSLDEAFLDVTGCQRLFGPPEQIAARIKRDIRQSTALTASVGVAPSRFVAKLASDLEKPDGLVVIRPEEVLARLAPLAVGRVWGVGEVTAQRLARLGITTIGQLREWSREVLQENFGSGGEQLYDLARGIDASPVSAGDPEKSVSNEITFAHDLAELSELEKTLLALADKVAGRVRARGWRGRTVQLKLRYADFSTITRRQTLPEAICTANALYAVGRKLLRERTEAGARLVRLLGLGMSGFDNEPQTRQQQLFETPRLESAKSEKAERAVDAVRNKLGDQAIGRARLLEPPHEDD